MGKSQLFKQTSGYLLSKKTTYLRYEFSISVNYDTLRITKYTADELPFRKLDTWYFYRQEREYEHLKMFVPIRLAITENDFSDVQISVKRNTYGWDKFEVKLNGRDAIYFSKIER